MKPLEQNEIFQNLSSFLKTRGIELRKGSYAQGIQKSCALLTNAINLGQESFGRAKGELDKTVEQIRRVIHEKTAPKARSAPPPAPPPTAAQGTGAGKSASKPGKAKARAGKPPKITPGKRGSSK